MFPEIGQFALIMALALAFLQCVLPLYGIWKNDAALTRGAPFLAFGQSFFVLFAFLILEYAFVSDDFSVAYVAANSNSHLPLFYKIAGVWSAHEGSILLWVVILAIWTLGITLFNAAVDKKFLARVLAVMGGVSFGFLLFMIFTSNPFLRLLPDHPLDGNDLNPLLQDPGLVTHPPILYMGYVGTTVAFAFALAALMAAKVDREWVKWTRPWTIIAWCFLTLGITLGSWWAYRDLGWGGWWFWDPVENASFMPWLVTTALIHSLIVTEKRGAFKNWTLLLAIIAFLLSLIGTFLVRSGVLTSVHAFAVDPTRGIFLLEFLALIAILAFVLYAIRAPRVPQNAHFDFLSRESLLLANNMLLFVLMATVLLGTLYPLILQVLQIAKISVGAPYFNSVFVPLVSLMFFFMGFAPACHWQHMSASKLLKQTSMAFLLAIVAAILLPWLLTKELSVGVVLGLSAAFWIVLSCLQDMYWRTHRLKHWKGRSRTWWGMIIAHIGVAITIIGITLTSHYSREDNIILHLHQTKSISGIQLTLVSLQDTIGSNYQAVQGQFLVQPGNYLMIAAKRFYPISQTVMSIPGIHANVWRDIYIAMGAATSDQTGYELRIYQKPFVRWIWFGAFFMVVGGIIAIFPLKKFFKSV